ncbi:hypothetical protein SB778_26040 [Paraburkholderia sp. SIMBA_050]|jgi:hypothetical protein
MVLPDLMLPHASILPRSPRDDQSAERHRHAGMKDSFPPMPAAENTANKKSPANFAGPFPVLKPVPG